MATIVVITAYIRTTNKCNHASLYVPFNVDLWFSTAWTNGSTFDIFTKVSPSKFKSNQMPDSHADRLVNSAPQTPPTCFTVKTLPHNNPKAT